MKRPIKLKPFDCVVIGAGLAGLSASLRLCRKGYKPLIIEQDSQTGGYAINFRRKPYRFEGSLHSIHGCEEGGICSIFNDLDLHDEINPIRIKNFKHEYDVDNGREYHWSLDREQFCDEYKRKYPESAENIDRFFKVAFKMGKMLTGWNDISTLGKIGRSFQYLGGLPVLMKYLTKSTKQLLDDYFQDQDLIKDLMGFPSFTGSEPEEMSAIVFFSSFFERFYNGAYYIEGGSGHLSKLLANKARKCGVKILLNHKVADVEITDKSVTKLLIEPRSKSHKRFILDLGSAPVLFCCDPHQFKDYLIHYYEKDKYFKALAERDPTDSLFEVYLGLDIDVRKYGFTNYTNVFDILSTKLNVIIYSNIDPTCCPDGHSNICIIKFMEINDFERLLQMDNGQRGNNYKKIKELFTQEIIEELEVAMNIDLKSHIVKHDAATPITFRRYTSNYRGALAGATTSFKNMILHRMGYKTGVKNLFFASQWVGLGGGFHNVMRTGLIVADKVERLIKRNKRKKAKSPRIYELKDKHPRNLEEIDNRILDTCACLTINSA